MSQKKRAKKFDEENILIGHPLMAIRRMTATKRTLMGKLIEIKLDNGFIYQLGSDYFRTKNSYKEAFDIFARTVNAVNPGVVIQE